jgi:alpha-galactosidase
VFFISLQFLLLNQCQTRKTNTNESEGPEFHKWAQTPPMGWNSWDCYGPTVVEDEVKANADYMAKHLKKFGWEYIVVDIRWYVENTKAGGYNQKDPVYTIDEYGRFTPAVNRFPSAVNGNGFKPLADYVHSKGLKFGIHVMRGIPVIAVNNNLPVFGTSVTAKDIFSEEGQCRWLRDMYTIVAGKEGAQEYYNSIMDLYASWGVDFLKIDDLSSPYHSAEIKMIRNAIDRTGREIVLSTSPGPTPIEQVNHIRQHANMWRTVGDFWDNWPQLKDQFEVFELWAPHVSAGAWPDGDMLPLGRIGIRAERGEPRMTGFTRDEQYTLMTLFAIFRSPLMFGGDLPSNDKFTLSLITNKGVLEVNQHSVNNKLLFREKDIIAWTADDPKTGDKYLALFNASDQQPIVESKAIWKSDLITQDTPGQSTDIDIDITGAEKLYLVVIHQEDRTFGRIVCDWIEPELIGASKSVNMTDLEWTKVSSGRREPTINKTNRGGKLNIDNIEYEHGISTIGTSIIEYDLPEGYTQFIAKAGIDKSSLVNLRPGGPGGQGGQAGIGGQEGQESTGGMMTGPFGGGRASATFMIFLENPAGPIPPDEDEFPVKFEQLGLTGTHTVKDLWSGKKLGRFTNVFTQTINRHGAGLYRIH